MAKLPDPIIFSETNLLSFKKQAKTKIVNSTRKYCTWMLIKYIFWNNEKPYSILYIKTTSHFNYYFTFPASKLSGELWQGGREKELEFHLQSPCGCPHRLSWQFPSNQRKAKTTVNVNKHWKTHAKGMDIITYVISTNQHFASTFSMLIFKFQRHSCKLSFLFPPRCQSAPENLLAGYILQHHMVSAIG